MGTGFIGGDDASLDDGDDEAVEGMDARRADKDPLCIPKKEISLECVSDNALLRRSLKN